MPIFNQITIVGVGLIGGSIGLDVRCKRLARKVVGVGRRSGSLRAARKRGAVDATTLNIHRGVKDAELVILATSAARIAPLAAKALESMRPGALLTDVGSTKEEIATHINAVMNDRKFQGLSYIGSHPLAGSHERGPSAARRGLFRDALCILAGSANADKAQYTTLARFWRALGMRVVRMDAAEHDRLLAQASHLPHVVAVTLVNATEDRALRLAASGFADTTRIAASDALLWTDIFLTNRKSVLRSIKRFKDHLSAVEKAVKAGDAAALSKLLDAARARRRNMERR